MTLVDTNVLLDLVTDDPVWAEWSIAQLEAASLQGPLLINDIIYAELSVRYDRMEDLDAFIDEAGLEMLPFSRATLFLAAKAFTRYRQAGGGPHRGPARFPYRRAGRRRSASASHTGCRPLPHLFSVGQADCAGTLSVS